MREYEKGLVFYCLGLNVWRTGNIEQKNWIHFELKLVKNKSFYLEHRAKKLIYL